MSHAAPAAFVLGWLRIARRAWISAIRFCVTTIARSTWAKIFGMTVAGTLLVYHFVDRGR
jgi:hypothetical protein